MFNFLSVEMHAYLCAHDQLTIYFLKEIMAGKKKCKRVLSYGLIAFLM